MAVKFEYATDKNVKEIIDLCNECFGESSDIEYAKKVFKQTRKDPNQIYINGYIDGVIVAHARIQIIPTIYQDMGTYAILNHFCVKESYRRKHIATDLMKKVVSTCKENKCKKVCMWSRNFRVAAHAFYKKFGFDVLEAGFFSKEI